MARTTTTEVLQVNRETPFPVVFEGAAPTPEDAKSIEETLATARRRTVRMARHGLPPYFRAELTPGDSVRWFWRVVREVGE